MKHITVDEALKRLEKAKRELGGDACLILSLTGSGIEDRSVEGLKIVHDDESRYVEVRAPLKLVETTSPDSRRLLKLLKEARSAIYDELYAEGFDDIDHPVLIGHKRTLEKIDRFLEKQRK